MPGLPRRRRDGPLIQAVVIPAIHGDRLARNRHAGWQYLHLAIDDDPVRARALIAPAAADAVEELLCRATL